MWDAIVCGGGVAGIAAALSAKRSGAEKVLLIEREFALGGLATLGLVTIYLPLCDGKGEQVSYGIAEELMRLSVSLGAEKPIPACWSQTSTREERAKERFMCRFNANLFSCLAERLLISESIDLLYGTQVIGVIAENSRIEAVVCSQREGEKAYAARGFVDASGDAVLFHFAGEKTAENTLSNRQAAWYYSFEDGQNRLNTLGTAPLPGELGKEKNGFTGLNSAELTRVMTETHRLILEDFLAHGNLSERHVLTQLPSIPQVRMSRRIVGEAQLSANSEHCFRHDSVGMISSWRESGPVYEIPFGALYGVAENLFAAGRIISSDTVTWDLCRVIPGCAVSGEAAGIAAVHGKRLLSVQNELSHRGIPLHLSCNPTTRVTGL